MGKSRIIYCIPCSYGVVPTEFFISVLGMQKYMGETYNCEQDFFGTRICYPDVARNELIDMAVKASDEAYALFLDVDQIYPADTPERLKNIVDDKGGIALGFVRKRVDGLGMVYGVGKDGVDKLTMSNDEIAQKKGVHRVGGAGFGGVMMKVATLRKFKQPVMMDYYDDRGVHVGEDAHFFRECFKKNISVWMDFDLKFPHLTTGAV